MPLTVGQFGEFFNVKRNGTFKCPFCSSESFGRNISGTAPLDPPDSSPMALLHLPIGAPLSGQAHVFYSISCTNCGHSQLFHGQAVDSWLETRNAAEEAEKDG